MAPRRSVSSHVYCCPSLTKFAEQEQMVALPLACLLSHCSRIPLEFLEWSNFSVRAAPATLALVISCAGNVNRDAADLLEPTRKDPVKSARQVTLVHHAVILIQCPMCYLPLRPPPVLSSRRAFRTSAKIPCRDSVPLSVGALVEGMPRSV